MEGTKIRHPIEESFDWPYGREGRVRLDQLGTVIRTEWGILVATDGSLQKDGSMGAAIHAGKNSALNAHFRVLGKKASVTPETDALECFMARCPREEEYVIGIDNMTVIQNWLLGDEEYTPEVDRAQWRRIRCYNKEIVEAGGKVTVKHIHSHQTEGGIKATQE